MPSSGHDLTLKSVCQLFTKLFPCSIDCGIEKYTLDRRPALGWSVFCQMTQAESIRDALLNVFAHVSKVPISKTLWHCDIFFLNCNTFWSLTFEKNIASIDADYRLYFYVFHNILGNFPLCDLWVTFID